MSAAQDTLPYSISTGSAYTAFDKLQGARGYIYIMEEKYAHRLRPDHRYNQGTDPCKQ